MRSEKTKQPNEFFIKCSCGCGQQLLINDFYKGSLEINTRIDGRRRWTGVILDKKDLKRLKDFL